MLHILLLSLSIVAPKAECIKSSKIPSVVVRSDKNHYIKLLEGEETFCDQLASDFNAGVARRVCGCQHVDYQFDEDTVKVRCASVEVGKLYSYTVATYYYYPDMVPACIRFRDLLIYQVK